MPADQCWPRWGVQTIPDRCSVQVACLRPSYDPPRASDASCLHAGGYTWLPVPLLSALSALPGRSGDSRAQVRMGMCQSSSKELQARLQLPLHLYKCQPGCKR